VTKKERRVKEEEGGEKERKYTNERKTARYKITSD